MFLDSLLTRPSRRRLSAASSHLTACERCEPRIVLSAKAVATVPLAIVPQATPADFSGYWIIQDPSITGSIEILQTDTSVSTAVDAVLPEGPLELNLVGLPPKGSVLKYKVKTSGVKLSMKITLADPDTISVRLKYKDVDDRVNVSFDANLDPK